MRFETIHAENYASYQKLDIDFGGLGRIFTVGGHNGAGKTTLFKGMTVLLYAQTPTEGAGIAKFVRNVSTWGDAAKYEAMRKKKELPVLKMEGVLVHGAYRYRIIRTFDPNIKQGGHMLNVQRKPFDAAGGWEESDGAACINEQTIPETQELICRLFGNYKSFITSTFLSHGVSGFLDATDEEREDVAAFLFDCDGYDKRLQVAGDKRRDLERDIEAATQNLAVYRDRAARKEPTEKELATLRVELESIDKDIAASTARIAELQTEKERSVKELAEAQAASQSISEINARIVSLQQKARDLQALIGSADELRRSAERLKEVRAGIREQQEKLSRQQDLEIKITRLKQQIEGERVRIESLARQLTDRVSNLESLHEQVQYMSGQVAEIDADLAASQEKHGDIETSIIEARGKLASMQEGSAKDRTMVDLLRVRLTELRENFSALSGASACCPTCERAFQGDVERQKLIDKFTEEGKQKSEKVKELQLLIAGQDKDVLVCRETIRQLEAELSGRQSLVTQRTLTLQKLEQTQKAITDTEALRSQMEAYQSQLANNSYSQAERDQLQVLQAEVAGIGFNQATYTLYLQEERQLSKVESEVARLERAEEDLQDLQGQSMVEMQNRAAKQETAARYDAIQEALINISNDISVLQEEQKTVTANRHALAGKISGAELVLDDARLAEEQIKGVEAETRDKQKGVAVYRVLEAAFAPRGIPKMKYDRYLPALTNKVNYVLSLLSPGWSIAITSSINNRGKFVIPIDTVDPKGISMAYAQRSNGEKFILALSFLIGMGLFWGERTGAQPEHILVDEGFGALDANNLEKAKNVIAAAAQNFGQVGIISHREELLNVGQVQLSVYNDPREGSMYEIAGVGTRIPRLRMTFNFEAEQARAIQSGISMVQENVPGMTAERVVEAGVAEVALNAAGTGKPRKKAKARK